MSGARRLGVLSMACALIGALTMAACVTKGHVESRHGELSKLLDGMETEAMICAPRELAEARANLEFAVYEAGVGQTTRAWRHLELAEDRTAQAWEASRAEDCEPDSDLDGVRDSKDQCPTEAEDYDGDRDEDGCPDADADGDGIDDAKDACPDEPEDKDGYQDSDGCPEPDNDGDGIKDEFDQCPMEAEDRDGHDDVDGCPDPDNDGDGIMDVVDQCPNQPEDMDGDKDDDGCPDLYKSIVVTKTRIELKQKIFFKTGKATILAKSYEILNEVADVLIKNPELRARIEGHTDSKGSARYNKKLSQSRADSVRSYLVGAGVEASSLVAIGYGEEVPIDSNDTDEGRARNRRVEFHLTR